jgi:hypothetical protein
MPPRSLRRPRLVRAIVVGLIAGVIVVAWMGSEHCGVGCAGVGSLIARTVAVTT